jgi:hypothetical protein
MGDDFNRKVTMDKYRLMVPVPRKDADPANASGSTGKRLWDVWLFH